MLLLPLLPLPPEDVPQYVINIAKDQLPFVELKAEELFLVLQDVPDKLQYVAIILLSQLLPPPQFPVSLLIMSVLCLKTVRQVNTALKDQLVMSACP
jgi:hypothetical protein